MGKKLLKTHKVNFQDDAIEFRWYIVIAAFNWERKIAENIEKRFESLGCSDKFKEIVVPIVEFQEVNAKGKLVKKNRNLLEPGYVFINMVLTNETWNIVRQTTGVAGWLNMDGRPSQVDEKYIINIKKQLGVLPVEEKTIVEFNGEIGDTICIKNHAMNGLEAKITEIVKDKELVKATMDNGFKVELYFEQIELVGKKEKINEN